MSNSALGLLVGLIIGIALAFGGFGDALIVALLGAIGWVVARVMEGELDVTDYLGGGRGRR